MGVVFLGTPDFAVPSLEAFINSKHEVVCVVTQPDKPVGRSNELKFSAVKNCALKHGIQVLQYDKISTQGVSELSTLGADVFVTCAYGQILSKDILDIPRKGTFNVHASLLPKYRGASPIQQAVINGDKETGVTIMKTEVGLDSGDIVLVEKTQIGEDETAGELFDRLALIGANLIVDALDLIDNDSVKFIPQDESKATFVKQLKKADAEIDFSKTCKEIKSFVNGMQPWPCAFTFLNGLILKIYKVNAVNCNCENSRYAIGEVVSADIKSGLKVNCGNGFLEICELQLQGAKRMQAKDFLLGRKIKVGDVLGK